MQENKEKVTQLIQSKVSLAPMAGITDYVLRSLVRKYSKNCLLTTEMISSEFLAQVKGGDIVKRNEDHSPVSYQISGHKPHLMRAAAEYLSPMADMIDINMGCPVNKVVKGQDGCALMRTPELASDLVKAVKDGTDNPVSVKFRLGYTFDELNYVEFGQKMQEAGAEFITIHGRTRSQLYSGNADWKMIRKLKENVDIPVFANGDVISIETAEQCLEQSGADGIAIGRGVLGDPTLLFRIENFLRTGERLPVPPIEERIAMLKWHLDEEIKLRGEKVGIKFFRKFYPYYIAGMKNAAKIRSVLVTEENYDNIMKTLNLIPAACF
ncbi:MAG: tRNA dihydrouridine synthase DusB [Brachyspira sp.]|jgi:putative TIM-barrel protein, nifR3 family|nr:tRNA dihydrouridine synthase DusB [Brachyspira sp.]